MNRRSFLGSIAALVAFPRSLFARQPPITLGRLREDTYSYKVTYVTDTGEMVQEDTAIDRTWSEPTITRYLSAQAPGEPERLLIGYTTADGKTFFRANEGP